MADVSVLVRRGKAVAEHRRQTEQCSKATFLPEKKPLCTARRRMLIEPIRAAAPIPPAIARRWTDSLSRRARL